MRRVGSGACTEGFLDAKNSSQEPVPAGPRSCDIKPKSEDIVGGVGPEDTVALGEARRGMF